MRSPGRITRLDSLSDLPKLQYTGYYWLSDRNKADLLSNQEIELHYYESGGTPTNPFVVEANIYNATENISISVRHLDGKYLIILIEWNVPTDGEVYEHNLLGQSCFGGRKLRFREAWIPEVDEYSEGFEVLCASWIGFIGFGEESDDGE